MKHSPEHDALLMALLYGEVDADEEQLVAALLEACPDCPGALKRFESIRTGILGGAGQGSIRMNPPTFRWQLPFTIRGPELAVRKELNRLEKMLVGTSVQLLELPLSAGADGSIEVLAALLDVEPSSKHLVELARAFLDSRATVPFASDTILGVGSYVMQSASTGSLAPVRRKMTAEARLTEYELARLIRAWDER